jgi:hypothetical protein
VITPALFFCFAYYGRKKAVKEKNSRTQPVRSRPRKSVRIMRKNLSKEEQIGAKSH